jgi:hypothetical protein
MKPGIEGATFYNLNYKKNMSDMLKINPQAQFNSHGYFQNPTTVEGLPFAPLYVDLFDQNGYDLTRIEQVFCRANGLEVSVHRNSFHQSLRTNWMYQDPLPQTGPILNHCYLFERKGYRGQALKQLQTWARDSPLYYKVINIVPKWGIDFSMDYVDHEGNSFELLHYEYDAFKYEDAVSMKELVENKVTQLDWAEVARDLLVRKSEWINLEFFEQSSWKCRYFGLPDERFKMVCWQN